MNASRRNPNIEERINRSSLGTPEARRLRASVPAAKARAIVSRAAGRRIAPEKKPGKFGG